MSTADVGIGGPPAPQRGMTLVARLQALAAGLRTVVARLLDPDDSALAAWAAAFAKAPQAVPDLSPPPNKRLARFVVGFVVGAHVALLAALWWRSSPPPSPPSEMTVELVREMPEVAKPKPAETKPEPKPLQLPVQEGKSAEHKETTQQKDKQEQQTRPEQHQAKQEPKPEPKQDPKPEPKTEARQPKPVHQRQAHRTSPPKDQPQKAQEQQKPQEQPKPAPEPQKQEEAHQQAQHDPPPAMAAVALPGASDAGTEAVSYQQLVLSQVAKAKKQGRYMGVPGYAGVRFRVGEDGALEMVKLVVSSGDPNLDIEAESMIRRAAPFPKPPPGGRRDYGITLVFAAQPAP